MLLLLKAELKQSDLDSQTKLLIWAVTCISFFGGFRVGELLTQRESYYDPNHSLTKRDVKVKTVKVGNDSVKILQIHLKTEKTSNASKGTIVDVYQSGGALCPINAFTKWERNTPAQEQHSPMFSFNSGVPLTCRKFNKFLTKFLGKHVNTDSAYISGHSLRSGIASLVAQLGYTDSEIMSLGRWSSQSYLHYLKLPRTRRLEMAKSISRINY